MKHSEMTRRTLLAVTAAAVLGLGVATAQAQSPENVLIVGQIAEPKALDPDERL